MTSYLAVDTGGTFTDLAVFDAESRQVQYTKSLTTPRNPIEGILSCVSKVKTDLTRGTLFKHGTTLVINTLIERSGPAVALVTTKGFRDSLELGRGNRTETFNLFFRRDPPLVPRENRFELEERVDGEGAILASPQKAHVEQLAGQLRRLEFPAIAICFLNSYLEPANELLVAGWLREMLPNCFITASTELTREWYEHERATTVAANAYVGPKVSGYISAMENGLGNRGYRGKVWLMGSAGGILSAQHASASPVLLVESGPVGGCIGTAAYGKALGIENLIAFDMGGTTAKCALVRDGRFNVTSTYYVGDRGKGIPIRAPVIDIIEVGTGGGSIAHLDDQRQLKVGPKSASSIPGPVCYGRGGTAPTVTDANLILGRLNGASFQGGEMALDVEGARNAFEEKLAKPLGYSGEKEVLALAAGVLRIATIQMSEAIKRISVACGQDARDYALFAFGGGGPLHGVELARELSIPLVIIPPEAGNFSALGMLLADVQRNESRTFTCRLEARVFESIEKIFAEMEGALRESILNDFGDVPVRFERFSEMRFIGQFHAVRVRVQPGELAQLSDEFSRVYRETYGHVLEKAAVEIVSLHSVAYAATPKPDITDLAPTVVPAMSASVPTRPVYFAEADARLSAAIYRRSHLPPGFAASGPAVIEEYGSTTVIGPQDSFEVGRFGELRVSLNNAK